LAKIVIRRALLVFSVIAIVITPGGLVIGVIAGYIARKRSPLPNKGLASLPEEAS